jgi:hypothetical protein
MSKEKAIIDMVVDWLDLDEHSLAILYDYDIVPLPDDIIDKANKIEREK